MLTFLLILQTLIAGWWVYLQLLPSHITSYNYLFNGVYGLMFFFGGFVGIRYSVQLGWVQSTVGRALTLVSSALISYGVGQFIWMWYNLILRQEVPYPSYADLFFVLTTPLFGVGFWYMLKMYRTFVTKRYMIEFYIAAIVSTVVITFLIGPPDVSGNLTVLSRALNVYYPLGDSILIALAFIAFRTSGGKMDRNLLMFIIGILLLASGDTLFTFRNNNSLYWNGDITDLLFSFGGFFMSLGVVKTIRSFVK